MMAEASSLGLLTMQTATVTESPGSASGELYFTSHGR